MNLLKERLNIEERGCHTFLYEFWMYTDCESNGNEQSKIKARYIRVFLE